MENLDKKIYNIFNIIHYTPWKISQYKDLEKLLHELEIWIAEYEFTKGIEHELKVQIIKYYEKLWELKNAR